MAQLKDKAKGQEAKKAASKYDLPFSPSPLSMVSLPQGLNSEAIRMLLKQMGIEMSDDLMPKAMGPTSKALADVMERRVTNIGPPAGMTDRRYGELLNLFGGRGPAKPK
jgi:hypothetical protein